MVQPIKLNKVLVIDDEPIMLTVLGGLLSDIGVETITTALSAEHALAALEANTFDLVFLDIELGGMNGLELLKRIRCKETAAPTSTKVIVVSSHTENPVLGTAIALDVNGILSKPVVPERLQKKLESLMSESFIPRPSIGYSVIRTDVITPGELTVSAAIEDDAIALFSLDELQANAVLAAPICSRSGEPLVTAGTELSETSIARLKEIREFLSSDPIQVEK